MLKKKITNWRNKILMGTNPTKFQRELLKIYEWILYPEFRKKTNILGFLNKAKWFVSIALIFIIWNLSIILVTSGITGIDKSKKIEELHTKLHISRDSIQYLINEGSHKDVVLANLRDEMNSRDYIEWVIKKDCHLRNPDNLTKLPNEVFWTIINEIQKHEIPYTIFFRLIDFESGFTFISNTSSGAFGYCQVLPSTWNIFSKELKLKEHNEINNIKCGALVLKYAYNQYHRKGLRGQEAWFRALVSYSGGSEELAKKELQYFKEDFTFKKEIKLNI